MKAHTGDTRDAGLIPGMGRSPGEGNDNPLHYYCLKNPPATAGDTRDAGLIPGSGRFPGGGNGNPLQNSCLENSMDRERYSL